LGELSESHQIEAGERSLEGNSFLRVLRLLLIDDNPHDRDLVTRALSQHFGSVDLVPVRDAHELERAIIDDEFDAAIIDYELRWTTGIEALRRIRGSRPDCPVLMFTGSGSTEVAVEAMKEGLDDYVTKTPKHYARLAYALESCIERRAAVAERKRAEEALRLADRRKDAFLATLAHELRNPLTPIRYATRLLEPGVPPQMAEDARKMIDRQLAQMARLLDDLLDVSRVTRGVLEIRREQLDLREIIETAVASAKPLAETARQELAVSVPAEPLCVSGDAVRLAQILWNLLHNATKYTPAGGHITVTATAASEEVTVTVKDDGMGIASEGLPKLFELFVQLDAPGTRSAGGLGIGLSLAQDLARMHGGRIEVHSEGPGLGSEFVLHLPQAREAAALTEAVAAPEKITALGASGIRVLIVDDNVDAATSLSYVLALAGYDTAVAHDGKLALEVAETLRPAIVLLDIGLPHMSGHEVARRLRAAPWGRDLRLIAVTGWGRESDRAKSLEAGFDAHLTKPIDPEMLLEHIAQAARTVA
jgi:signal transduction histidine kinase